MKKMKAPWSSALCTHRIELNQATTSVSWNRYTRTHPYFLLDGQTHPNSTHEHLRIARNRAEMRWRAQRVVQERPQHSANSSVTSDVGVRISKETMKHPRDRAHTKRARGRAGGGSLADWAVRPRLPDVEGGANPAEPRPSLRRPVVGSRLFPSRGTLRRGI